MLNNKDEKILAEIANNARMPINNLSKKIHISRELIDYHIKKLEKKEIILGYQARLNLNAFSILVYNILIKLDKYDEKREREFIQFIKEQNYTHFIAKIGGSYDYIIGFSIKKISDLKNYLDFIYENFNELIAKHELFTILDEIQDDFAPIFGKQKTKEIVSMKDCKNNIHLNDIDKKIIKEITNNAKISSVELGQKLNMTSAAIAYRIKKLENNNLILGYRTIIDILKLNKQLYYVFFNVRKPSPTNEKKIILEMKSNQNIIFTNRLAGSHSYLCIIVAENSNDFYNILKKIQNNANNIVELNIFSILDFIHHNYIPNGFLD